MNYLNSLYHLCKECTDFDKLFQLILDLSNIKMINDESYSKLCLSDHISYVLGKMNSNKAKGNNEINYGIKLIIWLKHEDVSLIVLLKSQDEQDNKVIWDNTRIINNKLVLIFNLSLNGIK